MKLGKVTASVVAPTKHAGLDGAKLLVVELLDTTQLIAIDAVGAGVGSEVIVATGSHACALVRPQAPVDAVIVGIVEHRQGRSGQ